MKLIQTLAFATIVAAAMVAQTPAQGTGGGQQQGSASPDAKGPAKASAGQAKPAAGTTGKAASTGAAKTTPAKPAAHKKTSPKQTGHTAGAGTPASAKSANTDKKPAVQTGVLPDKKKARAHKPGTAAAPSAAKGTKTAAPATTVKAVTATKPANGTKPATAVHAGSAGKSVTPPSAVKTKAGAKPGATAGSKSAKKTTAKVAIPTAAPSAKVTASAPAAVPEKKPAPRLIGAAGRRDPFVSPIRSASAVGPTQGCTSGKRCLAIPELVLQGTVRDISGKMLAVVVTSSHRTYTLRENDQVFNGSVEKITSDSIIFREYVKDALGRESAKEVVKKMGPSS